MARLDMLTCQLQPHFLFNALNAVSGLMYEDVDRADLMLERICGFLRSTARRSSYSLLGSISDELVLVKQYLEIMQTRFEEKLSYSIYCDPKAEAIRIPTLLLQPLVENAVKYCPDADSGDLNIRIEVEFANQIVSIKIRDRGRGPQTTTYGQGINNTKRRLATHYGNAAAFHLTTHPSGGALAELRVPA